MRVQHINRQLIQPLKPFCSTSSHWERHFRLKFCTVDEVFVQIF